MTRLLSLLTSLSLLLLFNTACQEDFTESGLPKLDVRSATEQILDRVRTSSVDLSDAERVLLANFDGTKSEYFIVEGDIRMAPEEYYAYLSPEKQHHTHNLVTCPTTIIIAGGDPATNMPLPGHLQAALSDAVNAYNSLSSQLFKLEFDLYPAFAMDDADIQIFIDEDLPFPAIAGFPTAEGAPFFEIRLNPDLAMYNKDVLTKILTHEIGHCIGFRHTDWETKISCSETDEAEYVEPYGAVHVPGTSNGQDYHSIMNSCPPIFLPTLFSENDRIAFYTVYGTAKCDEVKPDIGSGLIGVLPIAP